MKRILIITTIVLISFALGWWLHSLNKNSTGVKNSNSIKKQAPYNILINDTLNSKQKILKEELNNLLSDTIGRNVLVDTIIQNKETAIKIAEAILFNIYGEDNIKGERPYDVEFIDGHWILNGTLSEGWIGGTFLLH